MMTGDGITRHYATFREVVVTGPREKSGAAFDWLRRNGYRLGYTGMPRLAGHRHMLDISKFKIRATKRIAPA